MRQTQTTNNHAADVRVQLLTVWNSVRLVCWPATAAAALCCCLASRTPTAATAVLYPQQRQAAIAHRDTQLLPTYATSAEAVADSYSQLGGSFLTLCKQQQQQQRVRGSTVNAACDQKCAAILLASPYMVERRSDLCRKSGVRRQQALHTEKGALEQKRTR
jgi:hypothetical protein